MFVKHVGYKIEFLGMHILLPQNTFQLPPIMKEQMQLFISYWKVDTNIVLASVRKALYALSSPQNESIKVFLSY